MSETPIANPAWVAYLSALLTPTIAVIGSAIALLQWRTNRNRLKHELFDRRYEQFKAVREFLGSIMASGKATDQKQFEYLWATRGLRFVFDKSLDDYLHQNVWTPAVNLAALDSEQDGIGVGDQRTRNVRQQSVLKRKLNQELKSLDETFAKYLQLRH